ERSGPGIDALIFPLHPIRTGDRRVDLPFSFDQDRGSTRCSSLLIRSGPGIDASTFPLHPLRAGDRRVDPRFPSDRALEIDVSILVSRTIGAGDRRLALGFPTLRGPELDGSLLASRTIVTERLTSARIRIISARRATKGERRAYVEGD